MKKTINSIIRSAFLSVVLALVLPSLPVSAEWIPNYSGEPIPNAYYYDGAWYTTPPTRGGVTYTYNGNTYVTVEEGCPSQKQTVQSNNSMWYQDLNMPYYYDSSWHQSKPTQSGKEYFYLVDYQWHTVPNYCQSTQNNQPYYYDNSWHQSKPTQGGKDYWYDGNWYTTPTNCWSSNQSNQNYNRPYYYDNDWHQSKPTEGGKDYWYDGTWYTTPTTYQDKPYYYDNAWHEKMPEVGGKDYWYEGEWRTTPTTWYNNNWNNQWLWWNTSTPTNCSYNKKEAKPYYYDGEWRSDAPTSEGKSYWYDGEWRTVPTKQPAPSQRPAAYVDNYANTKASELISYANTNGVAGSYADDTWSANEAQKHVSFSGSRGSFDMTLTSNVGSDGNLVVKYWRAGIQRTLAEVQSMILSIR